MSVHDYLQVQCGCNDGQSYTFYADPQHILVAEGELEFGNHHSMVDSHGEKTTYPANSLFID